MDDDDFGGFEAAESYECGNGETQTTSPAIPWAAFPTVVSEVHASQNVSPDVLLEHSVPSSCLVPSDSFTLSSDNVATAVQTANSVLNTAVLKEQIQAGIPVASLNLIEDKSLVTSTIALDDAEIQRTKESKNNLQQTVASLEIKLDTAEEEKFIIKKELEYLLEKYSILEMDFLKEKKEKVISHQDDYKMLQEKHKQELEDMRKAGHEALSIIVEEFKALLQSTVQQREAAIEKQYILTIEKHSHKCEELLNVQPTCSLGVEVTVPFGSPFLEWIERTSSLKVTDHCNGHFLMQVGTVFFRATGFSGKYVFKSTFHKARQTFSGYIHGHQVHSVLRQ